MRALIVWADRLARLFAVLGGTVLLALIVLTCLSVGGRTLNTLLYSEWLQALAPTMAEALLASGIGPVNGDFEIVEAGIAFAIFAFIPLCQWRYGHASVDIFTSRLPVSANRLLAIITHVLFAFVLILIAFQLTRGMLGKYSSGQTTLLLQFPVWWSYAACVIAAWAASLVGLVIAVGHVVGGLTGQTFNAGQSNDQNKIATHH